MPKLWKDTVEEHRRDVRAAILEAAWKLAGERGVRGVTMAEVAQEAGIGRATLYKYFTGVEDILMTAHAEQAADHLAHLASARGSVSDPAEALRRLLTAYAAITMHRARSGAPDLQALVHQGAGHDELTGQLQALVTDAVSAAQQAGAVRGEVKAEELASYCLHALGAAADATSHAALRRLVHVVTSGLGLAVDADTSEAGLKTGSVDEA